MTSDHTEQYVRSNNQMAIDEELREMLRSHLKGMRGIEEKAMFGSICFMWRGNMLCGVMGDDLLVRVDKGDYDKYIGDKGAHPMVMGGKSGKSWILVPKSIVSRNAEMARWVDRAKDFVEGLPTKPIRGRAG